MKFTLKVHKEDPNMIEAMYKWQKRALLAFVFHVDCVDDADICDALALGEVEVEVKILKEGR